MLCSMYDEVADNEYFQKEQEKILASRPFSEERVWGFFFL